MQIRDRDATKAGVRVAIVALAALMLGACTAQYVPPPNLMMIHNLRPSTIQSLAWVSCDTPREEPTRLPDTSIAPRKKIAIALLPGCVNLFALDSQGQAAGEQYDLHMQPGTTWRIQ